MGAIVRLNRISNVILRVGSLERSLAFYRDLLGVPVLGVGNAFAFLDGGGVTLALNEIGPAMPDHPGVSEVVFEVEDVGAAFDSLSRRGVEFRVAPRAVTSDGDRDLLAADFLDPDGHVLSITGWSSPG